MSAPKYPQKWGDGFVVAGLSFIVALQLGERWWIVLVLYLFGTILNFAEESLR